MPSQKWQILWKCIEYGQECEKMAREELSKNTGLQIEECGLFIDASIPFLGASPDGVFDEEGIVEIKCPKTAENLSPEEAIKTVATVWRIFQDEMGTAMNKNHHYYYQVHGELHITDRKYCLFCLWTRRGFKCRRIDKDDNFWKSNMELQLIQFYMECMLPKYTSWYNRGMPIREP
ncbi:uncharacterized protein LOC143181370 [Calliopsis andreniformis]|uniref:uncharacterized protein LOC143181370 n=1 Tax=Calliopsis andreniformis TaxID=337506 RepID=UPI003FCDB8CB